MGNEVTKKDLMALQKKIDDLDTKIDAEAKHLVAESKRIGEWVKGELKTGDEWASAEFTKLGARVTAIEKKM